MKKWIFFLKENYYRFAYLIFLSLLISACASSDVQRDAASNMDMGVQNAKNLVGGAGSGDIGTSYQNASQATKGAIIGGTTGALAGAVTSGVGLPIGALTGVILGASYGTYIDTNTSYKDQLENRGATVVVLGDQILIMIPSARLFDEATATIKPQSYSTLDLVTRYINSYTKTLVKVAAYTNNNSSPADLSLSQEQANNVARMLVAYGLDARLVYAAGYGGTHLVENNRLEWDGNHNYRIEITLEKLYV